MRVSAAASAADASIRTRLVNSCTQTLSVSLSAAIVVSAVSAVAQVPAGVDHRSSSSSSSSSCSLPGTRVTLRRSRFRPPHPQPQVHPPASPRPPPLPEVHTHSAHVLDHHFAWVFFGEFMPIERLVLAAGTFALLHDGHSELAGWNSFYFRGPHPQGSRSPSPLSSSSLLFYNLFSR